jgi:TolB-like protein
VPETSSAHNIYYQHLDTSGWEVALRVSPALVISLLLMAGCALEKPLLGEDGNQYCVTKGIERGVSCAEGGFYDEAIRDFGAAIRRRSDDEWARTYGMHFADYFPHRELGVVYYRLRKYDDAITQLEISLRSADSAKAKHFLNEARKASLEHGKADTLPPTITVSQPSDGFITNSLIISVAGISEDDNYVSSVRVDGRPVFLELSARRFEFEANANLREGINDIQIEATDLTGKTTKRRPPLRVILDRQGPIVVVTGRTSDGSTRVVKGYVTDNTGIRRFSVNGEQLDVTGAKALSFKREVPLGPVRLEATDLAGNVSVAEIPVTGRASLGSPGVLLASVGTSMTESPMRSVLDAFSIDVGILGPYPRTDSVATVVDLREIPGLRKDRQQRDKIQIGVRLLDDSSARAIGFFRDIGDLEEICEEEARIGINVSAVDDRSIESLKVDGRQIIRAHPKQAGSAPPKDLTFTLPKELHVGHNKVEIEAFDSSGDCARRVVILRRKVPRVQQLSSRLIVGILPMAFEGRTSLASRALVDHFFTALKSEERFNLIQEAQVEEATSSRGFTGKDIREYNSRARQLGRDIHAEGVFTGKVREGKSSIEVAVRLIDTDTGNTLHGETDDPFNDFEERSEDEALVDVEVVARRLAKKIHRDFPLADGLVKERRGNEISVDIGEEDHVRKALKLILFRDVHGKRGTGCDTRALGEARIEDIEKDSSTARITKQEEPARIRDRVITK